MGVAVTGESLAVVWVSLQLAIGRFERRFRGSADLFESRGVERMARLGGRGEGRTEGNGSGGGQQDATSVTARDGMPHSVPPRLQHVCSIVGEPVMPGITRCEVLPLPDDRLSFRIEGREVTAWHFSDRLKRPFLYPVNGPASGASLTRMGHPGAPNHDHHDSVWFAHNRLLGIDFWGNTSHASIRQLQWLAMDDADEFARAAVRLGWFDGHDARPLVEQDVIIEVRPLEGGDYTIELTSRLTPRAEELEFQKTKFGFF